MSVLILIFLIGGCRQGFGPDDIKGPAEEIQPTGAEETTTEKTIEEPESEAPEPEADKGGATSAEWDETALKAFTHSAWDEVLPDTVLTGSAPSQLLLKAAGGEYEPTVLSLKGMRDLANVTAEWENLTNGTEILPKQNIDVRVVKVWEQGGRNHNVEEPSITIPELLVYDDQETLTGGWRPHGEFGPGVSGNAYHFKEDTISIPFASQTSFGAFTIDFYFRPDFNGDNLSSKRVLLYLPLEANDGFIQFHVLLNGKFLAEFQNGSTRAACQFDGRRILKKDAWVRYTLLWQASVPRLALLRNGIAEADTTCTTPGSRLIGPDSFRLFLGANPLGANPLDGWLDEVKIYRANRLLHASLESENEVENGLGGVVRSAFYRPPDVATKLNLAIPSGTIKTFWITVRIPPGQRPGHYQGMFRIREGIDLIGNVPIVVTVFPFSLEQPTQDFLIYYSHSVAPWDKDPVHLQQDLLDMQAHGLTGLLGPVLDHQETAAPIQLYRSLGLNGPIIAIGGKIENMVQAQQAAGFVPFLYGVDEPHKDNGATMPDHILKSFKIHKAGGKVATAIIYEAAQRLANPDDVYYDLLNPETGRPFRTDNIFEPLDVPNYHATFMEHEKKEQDQPLMDYVERLRAGSGAKKGQKEYYYWQSWHEKPLLNRLMAGFFLWTSYLDGMAPFTHSRLVSYEDFGDPFDDFDNQFKCDENGKKCRRDLLTVYPSQQGPIPTTKWEALREGMDDLRYLATLAKQLEAKKLTLPAEVAAIQAELESRLAPFKDPANIKNLSGDHFDAMRTWIQDKILSLQR